MRHLALVAALALAACGNPTAREICADMAAAVCAVETECSGVASAECMPDFEARCCEANRCTVADWETDSSPEGVAECLEAIEEASCAIFGSYLPDECRPPR